MSLVTIWEAERSELSELLLALSCWTSTYMPTARAQTRGKTITSLRRFFSRYNSSNSVMARDSPIGRLSHVWPDGPSWRGRGYFASLKTTRVPRGTQHKLISNSTRGGGMAENRLPNAGLFLPITFNFD